MSPGEESPPSTGLVKVVEMEELGQTWIRVPFSGGDLGPEGLAHVLEGISENPSEAR